ncbi:MAG TPA: papain-like cysteine protease family protein [Burkholderiaceae bacterium]|nr:papain-like cysteine protease family protein [Burkholderiaceae bacterium]
MRHEVILVPQATGMGCWAASIVMILSWKNQASFDPANIAANSGGPSYVPQLASGLDPNDRYILERNGFVVEPPQCYSLTAVQAMIDNGPLWVASYAPLPPLGNGPHIRVVTGYEGGRLYVNDPWPVNRGARYTRSFSNFFGQMETLGAREMKEPSPVYVAYVAD